jgi:hypothetical protein
MKLSYLRTAGLFLAALCSPTFGQAPPTTAQSNEAKVAEAKAAETNTGIPPRATPADYPSQGKAGTVTIAAEFTGHSVPKPEGPLSTEDYVVVEAALFGAEGQHMMLSIDDFSLRINGKKAALPSQPQSFVAGSLKDPQWSPPEEAEPKEKSKGGISTGGAAGQSSTPPVIHVPFELRRAMALYIQRTAMPQGDRPLPQAGLLFFRYFGGMKGIHSLELIYNGPAGKASLELQP